MPMEMVLAKVMAKMKRLPLDSAWVFAPADPRPSKEVLHLVPAGSRNKTLHKEFAESESAEDSFQWSG